MCLLTACKGRTKTKTHLCPCCPVNKLRCEFVCSLWQEAGPNNYMLTQWHFLWANAITKWPCIYDVQFTCQPMKTDV